MVIQFFYLTQKTDHIQKKNELLQKQNDHIQKQNELLQKQNEVFQEDANVLIKEISGDIIYLDPPYNERQYAPNFHLLETIAVWDKQNLVGKTGQRDYSKKKSAYSQKSNSIKAFEDLILNANMKYIILSHFWQKQLLNLVSFNYIHICWQVFQYEINAQNGAY
jgi:adenine-specific DNA methylase